MQNCNTQRSNVTGLVRCSMFMIIFGGFFLVAGITMTAVGHSSKNSYFYDFHRTERIIGPIFLSLGIAMVVTSIAVIYYARKEHIEAFRRGQHTTGVSGPIISGSGPPNTYAGAQGPSPPPMTHPTNNAAYTPQYGGVSSSQPVYPPNQPVYPPAPYPLPTAGAYPQAAAPSAPIDACAPQEKEPLPSDPLAEPPPSYEQVTEIRESQK